MNDDELQREWAYAHAARDVAKATLRAILDLADAMMDVEDALVYRELARTGLAKIEESEEIRSSIRTAQTTELLSIEEGE